MAVIKQASQSRIHFEQGTWQKNLTDIDVPLSPLHGQVSGRSFVPDKVEYINRVLKFKQNSGLAVDREIVIGIPISKKESPSDMSFTVQPYEMFAHMPAVSLRYREPDKKQLTGNLYLHDFSLKLKFGLVAGDELPVKVYLCLPDRHHSFIAGQCVAKIIAET